MRVERPIGWVQDIGLVALLMVAGAGGTHPASGDQLDWSKAPDGLAYALVFLAALPFLIRRRHPAFALAGNAAAILFYLAEGYALGPIMLGVPVAAYTAGSLLPLRQALIWTGVYYGCTFGVVLARLLDEQGGRVGWGIVGWTVASLAAFAAPLAVGVAIRVRRESAAGVRTAHARRAVSEERLRMAQDLHDSVGHGLAVIAMQAGVALHVLDRNPEKTREALEAIRVVSRESLDGLRAELEALRAPADDDAPRRPGLGLADVGVLLDRIRAGGVAVEADIRAAELPPDIDVAVYRILQESLTNVLRHAQATVARVRLERGAGNVVIEITDDGIGPRATAGQRLGSGIAGMRTRAEALGGTLEAGPRPGDGFQVLARLPLDSGVDGGSLGTWGVEGANDSRRGG